MTNINKEIIKKIKSILDYKYVNTPLKNLKTFFRSNINLKKLASDIRYVGIEQFEDDQEYLDNLKSLFDLIVEDKDAVLKDVYESKSNIKQFKDFIKNTRYND